MASLRVLHQVIQSNFDDAQLSAYVRDVESEPGCREAAAYRGVRDDHRMAIVELWDTQESFDDHWRRVRAGSDPGLVAAAVSTSGSVPSEFYRHRYFDRCGPHWVARGPAGRASTIGWPARGGVRVLIHQSRSAADKDASEFLTLEDAARREPGCMQFEWMRAVQMSERAILLELWENQRQYDAHWDLRLRTMPADGDVSTGAPAPAISAAEFYRHQPFDHLYDRWLPVDPAHRSVSVDWPD